jgi:RNA polymerase sigma-70 factor (ECF subfamily)
MTKNDWIADDGAPDIDKLFRQARPRLLAVARRVVRTDADAEDVLQQAFVNAVRYRGAFEGRAQVTSWMYRIVYNTALMHLRTRRRKGAESLDALPPELGDVVVARASTRETLDMDAHADRGRLAGILEGAMSKLSELDRRIVLMRFHEERSTREVAEALGISSAATKTRLHRARRVLQDAMSDVDLGLGSAA